MLKIELAYTIPNTWKLIFKLNNNSWKVIDCEKILSFPYAKELIPNIESFQEFKKHDTKISWSNEQMEICLDRLLEDSLDIEIK